jgi:hypothetical protein
MKAFRRILIIGLAIASVVLLVALGALLSSPLWIDSNVVKSKIAALVHQATGDVVQLDRLQLHLFPPVSVEIAHPRYTVAGSAEVAANAAVIDLDFLALLAGRVQPRGIRFTGLQATIHLSPASPGQEPLSLAAADRQLRDAIVQIAKAVPALRIAADDAIVTLTFPGQPPFALRISRLHARTSDGAVEGELACTSDAWQWLSLKFSIKGDDLHGNGLAEFAGLRVDRLRSLLGGADWPIAEAEIIGRIEWQMDGLANVRAEAIASSSRILLERNNATQSVDGVVVAAGLESRGMALDLHLHRLYVEAPHLLLSGNLGEDGRGHRRFDMQASGIDLPAFQAAARNLAPDVPWIANPPVSLSAGTLTALELRSSAEGFPQLFDPSVLAGEAAFEDVALEIARPAIRLAPVAGRVTLDRGELHVQNITAALGKSVLRNGTMSMNLLGNPVAVQADADVALDLAEALALARKVVTQKDARRQLGAVEKLEGNALAHVVLSGNLESPRTAIDVSELAFSARHRDVPLPIRLSRAHILYADDAISIGDATGALGRSGFSNLGASLKLAPPYRFELTQGSALLSIDELFPLATTRPELAGMLAELQNASGEIALSNVQADGFLRAPESVRFRVGASPRGMKIQTRRFAPQIELDGGTVDVSNRRIEVKEVAMTALDSELHVSGHTEDYRTGIAAIDAVVNGRFGAKTLDWIYQTTEIPRAYQVNAPLRFTDAQIGWNNTGEIAFKGKINVADTDLSIDARKAANGVKVERVTLKDPSTDASFGGELAGKAVKAWFKGKLAGETLKRMLVEPALSIGSLEGDIALDMDLDNPEEMHAKGRLQGTAIAICGALPLPVSVERIVLTADGRKVTLGETVVSSGENRAELSGSIYHEGKQFIVDADVRADRIVLPKSMTEPKSGDGDKGEPRKLNIVDFPIAGRVGVNIRSLEADGMEMSPLIAEARISGAKLDLRITQAALCGITLSGSLAGETGDLQLDGTLSARNTDLANSIGCITRDRIQGSGHVDVDAHFTARGAIDTLVERLAGSFSLTARDGNIEKFDTLNRVFAVLNVTEIARGKGQLTAKGMPYKVARAKGTLEGKVVRFDEIVLDAPTVQLVATGRVDYGSGKMAVDVMVAPLQTANAIIDKIPLLGRIFGGAVLALPVQVVGTVNNPIVVPLGPGAITTRMKSIISNTLKLPFDAIKVFSPNADQGAKAPDADK